MEKGGTFDIINDIIDNTTLSKLMDTAWNVNNEENINEFWIYYQYYQKDLPLVKE